MCADSQETVGSYRVSVQKIEPRDLGNFDIAIGGTGTGELIDAFIAAMEPIISASPITTLSDLQKLLTTELYAFMETEALLLPKKYRPMKFSICARSKVTGDIQLWRTKMSRLIAVKDYDLIGWEEAIYRHVVERHYSPSIPVNQAVLLGIRLLRLAESTSNFVKGPISTVILRDTGMELADKERVKELENELQVVGELVDSLLLLSADMNAPDSLFNSKFTDVQAAIQELRSRHSKVSLADMILTATVDVRFKPLVVSADGTVRQPEDDPKGPENGA